MEIDLYDQILISKSDDNACLKEIGQSIRKVNIYSVVQKFKENKISAERLQSFENKLETQEDIKYLTNQIKQDEMFRDKWNEFVKHTLKLLYDGNIYPILIKFLRYPYAMMSDVDILILDTMQESEIVELLSEAGFAFFQFRLLAHPLRITAHTTNLSNASHEKIDLDFYSEPMWKRIKICDSTIIFSRRTTLEKDGFTLFVPSPEDDLYLVGTHAFSHLTITLAEILHGLKVIIEYRSFDWKYLYNLAKNYACLDSTYMYLKTLDMYSRTFYGWSTVDEDVLITCEESRVCRGIRSWFKTTYSESIEFPLNIPLKIACIRSSFYRCLALLGHMPFPDLYYDFLSHYLELSSKTIFGTT